MALRLSFETGAFAGAHIVTALPRLRLGRDPKLNDILLTNPKVSRQHAVIERRDAGWVLAIAGRGPSKLNGDVLAPDSVSPLSIGDRLDLGGVELTFSEVTARLIVVAGDGTGRELVPEGPVLIGSGGNCDLVLAGAAPAHLAIEPTAFGFRATAAAKTFVNGRPMDVGVLAHGDELVIGNSTLRFVVTVGGAAAELEKADVESVAVGVVGELVFLSGPAKGERIPLGTDQIILGTRADCTVALNDPVASQLHCAISKSGDDIVVTDLGSTHGTLVNGGRITRGTVMSPGDLVAVGIHVLEARLIGGVTAEAKGANTFATMARNIQPRFVIDGRVVRGSKIVIGRAPSCDLIVEDPVASREHCQIEFRTSFVVKDTSSHGTYIDDRRIVAHPLPASCVLRVGAVQLRVAVHNETCTFERADAALAQAAVDVARRHATIIARGRGPMAGELQTIFRMDAGAIEQEIATRKKDLRRGAPAWRPSSDLSRDRAVRGAVLLSLVAAAVLCGGALAHGHGDALIDHPLSEAHSSAEFSSKVTGTSVCASCHSAGARIASERCATCHEQFSARAAHHGETCGDCHREHEGGARGSVLGAHDRCLTCHPSQHAAEFRSQRPQTVIAGPLPAKRLDAVALHAAHSTVVVGGKPVGIGCTSCHATASGTEGKPGLACFRCHQGGELATLTGCDRCHGREHAATLTRLPASSPSAAAAISAPRPLRSIGVALGLGLAGGSPALMLAAWLRLRRRRRQTALVDELAAHPAEVVKRLVHSINDSKCVGCGLCVQACPASVLELVDHKSRVVNFDSCIQCKKCETACAFDALRMHDADKPPPMIAMPSIDAFHETPVAGMFLIGQASGTPQVKNATNLGRAVIQRMVQRGLQPNSARALGCDVDVVIVGSGPAGLSAALTCLELGVSYVVLEKERASAWTIRNYYHKGKEVMAEPHDIALEASLPHWDTTREELLGAWEALVAGYRVDIRYQHDVLDVNKDGDRFVVTIGDPKGQPIGRLSSSRVVIAIGTLGNPRKLGCPGDELEKVKSSLVDPDEWTGRTVLVVGGSDSAVEVVLALSRPERRNRVTFSTRGAKLEGIKPKNRKLIEDALAANWFEFRYATQVAEVTPSAVTLVHRDDNRREQLPNDVVFALIGGTSPQKWLQHIGIPYVDKPHSWSPPRTDLIAQKTAEGLISIRRLAPRG